MRAIAKESDIDPALVIRYFTSKELLFEAVVGETSAPLPDLTSVPPADLGAAVARVFLERWHDPASVALLRVAVADQATADRVHATYRAQLQHLVAQVAPAAEAAERAAMMASQLIGLALARHVLLLQPLPDTDIDVLVAWIAPTLQHYLLDPLAAAPPASPSPPS